MIMNHFIHITKQNKKLQFSEPGDYIVFFHNLSGELIFEMRGPNINLNIYGLYVGSETDEFSIQTVQHHREPSASSNLLIKGVFFDNAKFHYRGLIRIEKKAQKSRAYQKNQNLMMSPNAFVDSKPYLEILANDVYCTHGSTTGRLNKEAIFYLMSRSIDKNSAQNTLIRGFISEIANIIMEKNPEFHYQFSQVPNI